MNPETAHKQFLDASGFAPAGAGGGRTLRRSYALKWKLLIVGLDAADVVRGGGVQRFHQQRQGAAELRSTAKRVRNGGDSASPAASRDAEQTRPPYLPLRFSAADWPVSLRAGRASLSHPCRSPPSGAPPLGKSWPEKETDNSEAGEKNWALSKHTRADRQLALPHWPS